MNSGIGGVTLRQAKAFLATIRSGSVSAAARSLRLSQPAVGQQLRELEGQLRIKLFERVGSRLSPTTAGLALAEPVARLFVAVGEIDRVADPFRAAGLSRVRLGTGATACIFFLPEPLRRTKSRLPGIEIWVTVGNTPDILRAVEEGSIDVGLVSGPIRPTPANLCSEALFYEPMCAILPRAMAARLPPVLGPAIMTELPPILYERGGATRGMIDGWFGSEAVPSPTMELGSIEAIKVLVGAGLGCSIVPALAATEGESTAVLALDPPLTRRLSLVARSEKMLDAGLRALLAEVRHFAAGMQPGALSDAPSWSGRPPTPAAQQEFG